MLLSLSEQFHQNSARFDPTKWFPRARDVSRMLIKPLLVFFHSRGHQEIVVLASRIKISVSISYAGNATNVENCREIKNYSQVAIFSIQ